VGTFMFYTWVAETFSATEDLAERATQLTDFMIS
jgi:hypothetical protein